MNFKPLLLSSLAACFPLISFAWGQKGHDTVAYIAENHLTPVAKAAVDSILDGRSLVYYSNWLDNASHTPQYEYSKTWHYKNIDAGVDYDDAPLLPAGDVVTAIVAQTALLSDSIADKDIKALALKMVTHFLGDIHQPMHLGHKSDLGGNRWKVRYFNRDNNLHSVWDSSIVESGHKWSYSEWQEQIDRATPEEQMAIISLTDPSEWARETYSIATEVYDTTPVDYNISFDYIAKWTPVIEQQFLKGGLRLAHLLNTIFDPAYE